MIKVKVTETTSGNSFVNEYPTKESAAAFMSFINDFDYSKISVRLEASYVD